jgi:hypothetical protein
MITPPLPFPRSYWVVPGKLLAGCSPGAKDPIDATGKITALLNAGIRHVINLMEPDERDRSGQLFVPYENLLERTAADIMQGMRALHEVLSIAKGARSIGVLRPPARPKPKSYRPLALGAYFKPGADKPGLEARIGLLTLALEGFDLPALRGRYPGLCGGGSQAVVLFEDIEGAPRLRVGELLVDTAGETANRPKGV